MALALQISFRNMDHSASAEAQVRRRAEELAQFSDRIGTCRVTLEATHPQHRQGRLYQVHIDAALAGGHHILVNRDAGGNHAHDDVNVAIRDAFEAARRQLQNYLRRTNGAAARSWPEADAAG
jgi:ribosome-associated translation inhibitor RaiA